MRENEELSFLSVSRTSVLHILSGDKRWEFRANPRFGILQDAELKSGNRLLIIESCEKPAIVALVTVGQIFRKEQFQHYFERSTNHWLEAGCQPDSHRDWDFFEQVILNKHQVAVQLCDVRKIERLAVKNIRQRFTGKPWKGIGLISLKTLKRFQIEGQTINDFFCHLVKKTEADASTAVSLKVPN
ncbi:MAG: hypothetical protein AB2809_04780 [Candidatus Thiodiazotropha sp.]